jgi:hypothetical protein
MQNALRMCVAERVGDLGGEADGLVEWKLLLTLQTLA